MSQEKELNFIGESTFPWYLENFIKYVLAFGFIMVTAMGDYLIYEIIHKIDRSWFYVPILSISYIIWNIKRIRSYKIYTPTLPKGCIFKLVDVQEYPLAYEMFSKMAPNKKSLEIYRCMGINDYYECDLTKEKAILYIEEETFLKISTDETLFYRFILMYLSDSADDLRNLAFEKASCLSGLSNFINGASSAIEQKKVNERNIHIKRSLMGAAIGGSKGAAAVGAISVSTSASKSSVNGLILIPAIGYLLVMLVFMLFMLPLILIGSFDGYNKAKDLLIREIFDGDKLKFKAYSASITSMDAPDFSDESYYSEGNGWSKNTH
jgi:hypothetical protein